MTDPKDVQKHSPTLARLLKSRLAPVREAALLRAAMDDEKPIKPAAGDCCGSSCNPCVMDLYRDELKVHKECAEYRRLVNNLDSSSSSSDSDAAPAGAQGSGKSAGKMPGSFEW